MGKELSNWEAMRLNAEERLETGLILFPIGYYTAVYENAFFAIEIGCKAFMLKKNPVLIDLRRESDPRHPWFSHDLGKILDQDSPLDRSLRLGCPREYNLLRSCCRDASIWKPWKRYSYRADRDIAELYLNLSEGLVKWMLTNLLKP